MELLTIEQLKELFEFYYGYDDLVTLRNHIDYVIENIDNGKYDNVSHESIYEQEMDNIKFCSFGEYNSKLFKHFNIDNKE